MEKIGAWIRDPRNNIFKGMSKRAALYELYCEAPDTCDLLRKENSCLNCGIGSCKFGRKRATEGPTTKARSFHKKLTEWKEANEGFIGRLDSLRAYNRIFRANGHFYLPYSFMSKEGTFLGPDECPLKSRWVPESEMTTHLLISICIAQPRVMLGDAIKDYQDTQVPKFIADLHTHYPEVFALLPDEQKARLNTISFIGRTADLTTCAPSEFRFTKERWTWDGEFLHGTSMLFQPVEGDIEIKIRPKAGSPVEITDDTQVTSETRFLD